MPSEYFRNLCKATYDREHALLIEAQRVRDGGTSTFPDPKRCFDDPRDVPPWKLPPPTPWRIAARIAKQLITAWHQFQADLTAVQIDRRVRRSPEPCLCPHCGEADCPECMLLSEMPPDVIIHLRNKLRGQLQNPAW